MRLFCVAKPEKSGYFRSITVNGLPRRSVPPRARRALNPATWTTPARRHARHPVTRRLRSATGRIPPGRRCRTASGTLVDGDPRRHRLMCSDLTSGACRALVYHPCAPRAPSRRPAPPVRRRLRAGLRARRTRPAQPRLPAAHHPRPLLSSNTTSIPAPPTRGDRPPAPGHPAAGRPRRPGRPAPGRHRDGRTVTVSAATPTPCTPGSTAAPARRPAHPRPECPAARSAAGGRCTPAWSSVMQPKAGTRPAPPHPSRAPTPPTPSLSSTTCSPAADRHRPADAFDELARTGSGNGARSWNGTPTGAPRRRARSAGCTATSTPSTCSTGGTHPPRSSTGTGSACNPAPRKRSGPRSSSYGPPEPRPAEGQAYARAYRRAQRRTPRNSRRPCTGCGGNDSTTSGCCAGTTTRRHPRGRAVPGVLGARGVVDPGVRGGCEAFAG